MLLEGAIFAVLAALAGAAYQPCSKAPANVRASVSGCASKKQYCSKVQGHGITYTTTLIATTRKANTGISSTTKPSTTVVTVFTSTRTSTITSTDSVTSGEAGTTTSFASFCPSPPPGRRRYAKRAVNPGGCGIKANVKATDISAACDCVLASTERTTTTLTTGVPTSTTTITTPTTVKTTPANTFTVTTTTTTTTNTLAPPPNTVCIDTFYIEAQDPPQTGGRAQTYDKPPGEPIDNTVAFKAEGPAKPFGDENYDVRAFYLDPDTKYLKTADNALTLYLSNLTGQYGYPATYAVKSVNTAPKPEYLNMPCNVDDAAKLTCTVNGQLSYPFILQNLVFPSEGDVHNSSDLSLGEEHEPRTFFYGSGTKSAMKIVPVPRSSLRL